MEFWGVEVTSGKPLTCQPGQSSYVHVSQAALGDNKNIKGNDRVVLKVKVGANEVVVGTLSQGKCDQTTLDLIFEKDFVLSHNSSGSVYFCGYKTDAVRDDDSMSSGSDEDEFEMSDEDEKEAVLPAKENGRMVSAKPDKAGAQVNKHGLKSPASTVEVPVVEGKSKAKSALAEKGKGGKVKSVEDDEKEDSEEDDEEEDSDEDDEMLGSGSDDDDLGSDEEDESDEESSEEEQPKVAMKKRPAPSLQAASAGKKAKADTPGKAEPKTPGSTPKQQQSGKKDQSAKKTPGKENTNTPASGKKLGQFFCQPCSKNFNSDSALSQHKTAKHKS
ncbi:hypothetical protein L7F22_000477 [Adiantum nelumboides]|nr:hypothetical protein [Adiantum nelumboides]